MTLSARQGARGRNLLFWGLPLLAFVAMYTPVYWQQARQVWVFDVYQYAPLIAGVSAWLIWRQRDVFTRRRSPGGALVGSVLLLIGVVAYVSARTRDNSFLEVASQIPVLAGMVFLLAGTLAMRRLWFPICFLIFMAPVPDVVIQSGTGHLKAWVAMAADGLLYGLGYPVARLGNLLIVGPYQLLVDDVCSGLHSIYSLSALGLLYLYLAGRRSWWHWLALAATILPIAVMTNVARVVILGGISYRYGSAVADGFAHSFSGVLLFFIALALLLLADALLLLVGKAFSTGRGGGRDSHQAC
ncbi:exosortase [Thiohalocapsa marina]|uniref:Exosortase n=1 Tax=Thiohalocapsa marina TaxID=424902 RepID=A0A5M8FL57_9GAMM|nr:exosortase [Thiohalocapsa marina]KAA6183165.1 exosortase [Thiohalocapsa marina]